jgi:hypothetical protein
MDGKLCTTCMGAGWLPGEGDCTRCNGSGELPRYPGWAGVCSSFEPETDPVEVHADVLPDEVVAVLALTPGVNESVPWAEREALAAAVAESAAVGLADSWWAFAEKPLSMDANGDVWA